MAKGKASRDRRLVRIVRGHALRSRHVALRVPAPDAADGTASALHEARGWLAEAYGELVADRVVRAAIRAVAADVADLDIDSRSREVTSEADAAIRGYAVARLTGGHRLSVMAGPVEAGAWSDWAARGYRVSVRA